MVGFKGARLLTDRINAVTSNNGNSNSTGRGGGRGAGAGAGEESGGGGVVFKEFPGHHAFLGFPIQVRSAPCGPLHTGRSTGGLSSASFFFC